MIIELKNLDEIDPCQLSYHANDPLVNQFLRNSFPYPYTLENALSFIQFSIDHSSVDYGIVINGECVGCIGVTFHKDIYFKNCEIGYWLGRDFWNRGIMTKVINMINNLIFQNYDISKICAEVFSENKASSSLLLKCGYVEEGYLKDHVYKNGVYHDVVIYSLRRCDYEYKKI